MKVAHLADRRRRGGLTPLKTRLLEYLESHPDEVFSYRDEQLLSALGVKRSALDFTLWALRRDGLIDRQEVDGKVYFGSFSAVADLRARLGLREPQDPFDRARANLERIRERAGNVNTQELLDAVRGSWE